MSGPRLRVGVLATHPIQYYVPWYRALAAEVDLEVFYSHRQTAEGQAAAGFGVPFNWDVPLLEGYRSTFLNNTAGHPNVERFWGCRTPELAPIIRDRHFDAFIVHGWSTLSYWQAILSCWRSRTPVLVRGDSSLSTPRSAWRRALKYPFYRWFIPRFDGYLVVGASARRYLQHYGARLDRCFAAPHAVDNDFFASRALALQRSRSSLRREFGLEDEGITLLFAGRFIERKEPEAFVRAIASVAAGAPGVTGLMVGDGPLREKTERLALELAAPVRFTGFLNQTAMVRAYVASDALVVPSQWETWGLVVNEAMACGLPAIVTDGVACAYDLVIPGQTGDVVPTADGPALSAAILRVCSDPSYRSMLSRGARRQVEQFSVGEAVAGTVRAIREISTSGRLPTEGPATSAIGARR